MRYPLFGVWLALLLAVGLAWMHERYSGPDRLSVGELRVPRDTRCYIFEGPGPDLGFDATWDHCSALIDALNDGEMIGGEQTITTQDVQVNNGVMIQVNQ